MGHFSGWSLLAAFIVGVVAGFIAFYVLLLRHPVHAYVPSARQRALFVAMRTAMDEARHLAVTEGLNDFVVRIDVLRGALIEAISASDKQNERYAEWMMESFAMLRALNIRPSADLLGAWSRAVYSCRTLAATIEYPSAAETEVKKDNTP